MSTYNNQYFSYYGDNRKFAETHIKTLKSCKIKACIRKEYELNFNNEYIPKFTIYTKNTYLQVLLWLKMYSEFSLKVY